MEYSSSALTPRALPHGHVVIPRTDLRKADVVSMDADGVAKAAEAVRTRCAQGVLLMHQQIEQFVLCEQGIVQRTSELLHEQDIGRRKETTAALLAEMRDRLDARQGKK